MGSKVEKYIIVFQIEIEETLMMCLVGENEMNKFE